MLCLVLTISVKDQGYIVINPDLSNNERAAMSYDNQRHDLSV